MYPSTKKVPTEQEALLRLSSLCSRSEHSTGEMRDKLRRWGVDQETSDRVVSRLVSERFVDDERYCRFFVRDKIRFDRWGRRKIEQALYAKGVDQDISAAVLDEVDDEEWTEALRPLLASKRCTVKGATDYERNGKLIRFAMSRGFDMDIIRRCMDVSDNDEEDVF